MPESEELTYQFLATIRAGERTIERVRVKAILPRRIEGKVTLLLYPTEEQDRILENAFQFSLRSEVRGFSRDVEGIFEAMKVYSEHGNTRMWGLDLRETCITASPNDFAKWDIRRNNEIPNGQVSGRFWLTPCSLLSPQKSVETWFTGEVKVKTIRCLEFQLGNGLSLSFDFVFRHFTEENDETVSFKELVANFKDEKLIGTSQRIEEVCLAPLDDFLMLASFAARQRSVCVGWEAWDAQYSVKFYRRGLTIPKVRKNSHHDSLIELRDFEKFLTISYPRFLDAVKDDFLRQALYAVTAEETDLTP